MCWRAGARPYRKGDCSRQYCRADFPDYFRTHAAIDSEGRCGCARSIGSPRLPQSGYTTFMNNVSLTVPEGAVEAAILTPAAKTFLAELSERFEATRLEVLERRKARSAELRAGKQLDFLPETADVRSGTWKVAPIPADLADRRVEITGPVDRKMIINALNSGANVFMADLEDSNS